MSARVSVLGLAIAMVVVLVTGCAGDRVARPAEPAPGTAARIDCQDRLAALDAVIAGAGVADAQAARVDGHPFLRVDRALAALRPPSAATAFATWATGMRDLDRAARAIEVGNIPPDHPQADAVGALLVAAERCAEVQLAELLADGAARARLADAVRVPSAYQPLARLLGLYPLAAIPFGVGIDRLHADLRAAHRIEPAARPVNGRLVRYAPAVPARPMAAVTAPVPLDVLGRPSPDPTTLAHLLAVHGPTLEVDETGPHDRVGAPRWDADGMVGIDPARPTGYWLATWGRVAGERRLQLVYHFWFSERPARGPLDLLAGRLDGLIVRLTLDADGHRVDVLDIAHACGCYHMVFPRDGAVVVRAPPGPYREPLLVPRSLPPGDGRLVLRVEGGTHHVVGLRREPPATVPERAYRLEDYARLRALPWPGGGTRSLFGPDGLVPGTERAERWLFWPMGVPSAGQMRQWGHHAVAFTDERHLDDPALLAPYLE